MTKPIGPRIFKALLVLALLLACGWFVISYQTERKIEKTLQEALEKHQLTDRMQWQGISASPLGYVVFKDVVFQHSNELQYKAEKIRISDLINQQDRLRLHLQLTQGQAVFSAATLKHLPASWVDTMMLPVDGRWQLDLDFAQDTGRVVYNLQVHNAYAVDFHLEISQIVALRKMLKQWLPGLALSTEDTDPKAWGGWLSTNLNTLDVTLHDRGLRASLSKSRAEKGKITPQIMQGALQALEQSCAYALPERALSCQHLTDFIDGPKNSLRLTAQPEQPVALWRTLRFNQKETIRLLNLRLE